MSTAERELPPMPNQLVVTGTVRNDLPVARVEFIDMFGDKRIMDMTPEYSFTLAMELLDFYRQVTTGYQSASEI